MGVKARAKNRPFAVLKNTGKMSGKGENHTQSNEDRRNQGECCLGN